MLSTTDAVYGAVMYGAIMCGVADVMCGVANNHNNEHITLFSNCANTA